MYRYYVIFEILDDNSKTVYKNSLILHTFNKIKGMYDIWRFNYLIGKLYPQYKKHNILVLNYIYVCNTLELIDNKKYYKKAENEEIEDVLEILLEMTDYKCLENKNDYIFHIPNKYYDKFIKSACKKYKNISYDDYYIIIDYKGVKIDYFTSEEPIFILTSKDNLRFNSFDELIVKDEDNIAVVFCN